MEAISEELYKFLINYFSSIRQLEIFLWIYLHPEKGWTAEQLARALSCNEWATKKWLEEFENKGILESEQQNYRFAPKEKKTEDTVKELARVYRLHPFTVIDILFNPSENKMKSFMDAFKIKKDPNDNG